MKIAFISSTYAPDGVGGRAKYTKEISDEFSKLGHDVTVITALWRKNLKKKNIIQFKIPKYRFLWYPIWRYKVQKYLKKNKFDVIHACGSREGSIVAPLNIDYYTTEFDIGAFQMKMRIVSSLIEKNLQKAKLIFTISPTAHEDFIKLFPDYSDKIKCIPLGINTTIFNSGIDYSEIKKKINPEGIVGLYLGRIAKYKGVGKILKAFSEIKKDHPSFTPVIVGDPTLAMKKQYDIWKQEYSDFIFTGYIPEGDIPKYYSMADLFVTFSNAGEGFGFTLGEAMACGTPVIAPKLPAYNYLIDEAGILVKIDDEKQLQEAIRKLVTNKNLREELGQKGFKRIHEKFSWE
ncbi:MAG: glycosyltransferase family 4 protein, partial [Candidatus Ranarchaeia archaeon]